MLKNLFVSSLVFVLSSTLVFPDELTVYSSPPSGFEAFEEPQTAFVDLFYQGRLKGEVTITYTLDTLAFEQPESVLKLLDDVKDKNLVLEHLYDNLPRNTHLACQYEKQKNCGLHEPEHVGVIFDESQLKVAVFVHPEYRLTPDLNKIEYLPESRPGFSSVHGLQSIFSGERNDNASVNNQIYYLNSYFSSGRHRINTNLEYSNEDASYLNTLSYLYESNTDEVELGMFSVESQLSPLLTGKRLLGFRMQSHLKRRKNLEQSRGTPIILFLSTDSRVDVYRAGRLIDSQMVRAGNQSLKTKNFPEGAYDVDLRIVDSNGNERRQRFFFSKSSRLPPVGESSYLVEVGALEDRERGQQDDGADSMFRFSRVYRPYPDFGLGYAVQYSNAESLLESQWAYLGRYFLSRLQIAYSDLDYWAYSFSLNTIIRQVSINANARKINSLYSAIDDQLRLDSQRSVSLTQSLTKGYFSLVYQHSRFQGNRIERKGVSFRTGLGRSRSGNWSLLMNLFEQEQELTANVGIQFNFNGTSTTGSIESAYNYVNVDANKVEQSTSRVNVLNRFFKGRPVELLAGVNGTYGESTRQLGTQSSLNSPYLLADLAYQRAENNSNVTNDSYAGLLNMNAATNGRHIHFGGERNNNAGVAVSIESSSRIDATFNVLVDNLPVKTVYGNASFFIPLSPYQTYELKIEQADGSIMHFDTTIKTFTLYPGRVEKLVFAVAPVTVYVGQLVDKGGRPIELASVENALHPGLTDEQGWFQVEFSEGGVLIFKKQDGSQCEVVLPANETQVELNVMEKAVCITRVIP